MSSNYELKIFTEDGKEYRQFNVDSINTIGVFENERFYLEFKNNSWVRIQCKVSLDGGDVLTGELASTEPTGKMWVIEPYQKLVLKSYQENSNGGGQFLFGKAKNSVAANTHNNLIAKNMIGIATFTEKYVQPNIVYTSNPINIDPWNPSQPIYGTRLSGNVLQPGLDEVIQIKYIAWEQLRSHLRGLEKQEAKYAAFPKDGEKFADLSGTPRQLRRRKFVDFERLI